MNFEKLYAFDSKPGIRRDGTAVDSPYFCDGEWVRWQRGLPRKMNGYKVVSLFARGPVRSVFVDSRNGVNSSHYFSQYGVQRQVFDNTGNGSSIEDRTPLNFTSNANYNWSHASMYSSTGGAYTAMLCAATPDALDITSDSAGPVYAGNVADASLLTPVSDGSGAITTSGGVCVLQPFLFVYGSNGLIRNSNANDFSSATGWTTGGANLANSANPAGTKIVYGAPLRGGGNAPSGLFWSLDSLVRVSFTANSTYPWQYDTLTNPMSVLSKKAIVEHDGKFFWPGIDRFVVYNGVVQELPNDMNLNYFYDNLNYAHQNKVWGTKIARWGEIWWFYPRGSDTECGNAVIYNYRENTWYDAVKRRSAGGQAQIYRFPIWAGDEDNKQTSLLKLGVRLQNSVQTLSGNNVLTFASTTGVVSGNTIYADGVPTGTTVSSFTATTVTMSANATATIAAGSVISFTSKAVPFVPATLVTGGTSGAVGYVATQSYIDLNVESVTGTFVSGETITCGSATAKLIAAPAAQELDSVYQHEYGLDKVKGQDISAIKSTFTSKTFGFAVDNPIDQAPQTLDVMTRISRFEPDYNQTGALRIDINARSFPNEAEKTVGTYTINQGQQFVETRAQGRILTVKITSDEIGGFYEQGQVQVKLEPGDVRSTT